MSASLLSLNSLPLPFSLQPFSSPTAPIPILQKPGLWHLQQGWKTAWNSMDRHTPSILSWLCPDLQDCKVREKYNPFAIWLSCVCEPRLLTRHRGTGLLVWTRCLLAGSCHPRLPGAATLHSPAWSEGRGNKADPWRALSRVHCPVSSKPSFKSRNAPEKGREG